MARILALCGVVAEDIGAVSRRRAPDEWHLWPCNARIWTLWCQLQTQWVRAGMDGSATGLDHAAVWADIDGLRMRGRRWVFEVITQMERATLDEWSKRREA